MSTSSDKEAWKSKHAPNIIGGVLVGLLALIIVIQSAC